MNAEYEFPSSVNIYTQMINDAVSLRFKVYTSLNKNSKFSLYCVIFKLQ